MSVSIEEKNKAIVLQAFDHFVQPTRLFPRRALLVATIYPAQRPHPARTEGLFELVKTLPRQCVTRSADFSERRFLDVAWSFFWSRRRNAELDRVDWCAWRTVSR